MNLLYAPAHHNATNAIEHNLFVGFDVQILETLATCVMAHDKAAKVFYLPPPPALKKIYEPCCLESLAHLPIEPIADLREAAQSMAMVTDVSSRIWEYAFVHKKPAILCLLGFSGRSGEDRLSKLIDLFAVSVFSLAELAETIANLPELVANTQSKIEAYLSGTIV